MPVVLLATAVRNQAAPDRVTLAQQLLEPGFAAEVGWLHLKIGDRLMRSETSALSLSAS